jgi:hypothetical protein
MDRTNRRGTGRRRIGQGELDSNGAFIHENPAPTYRRDAYRQSSPNIIKPGERSVEFN